MPKFSIVIPVYNEEDFLATGVAALLDELRSVDFDYSILIVENGSTDRTAELATSLAADEPVVVHSLPAADYGAAMRSGFVASEGDWIVNFDIDYFSASFLKQVVGLEDTADLVIASKRDPRSEDHRPWIRRLATAVFNLLLRTLFRSSVSDTHGMKAFRHNLVDEVVPQVVSRQDLFDTELVIRAERLGYRIAEVPVVVTELRPGGSLLKRVPRTLMGLWKIRQLLASETQPSRPNRRA